MADQPIERTETMVVHRDAVIHTQQRVYKLRSDEFLKLTRIPSVLAIWAHGFFAGTGVFALTVFSRWIERKYFGGQSQIDQWEWILLALLVVLVILLEILVYKWPSERKKITKKIEGYFDDNGARNGEQGPSK